MQVQARTFTPLQHHIHIEFLHGTPVPTKTSLFQWRKQVHVYGFVPITETDSSQDFKLASVLPLGQTGLDAP